MNTKFQKGHLAKYNQVSKLPANWRLFKQCLKKRQLGSSVFLVYALYAELSENNLEGYAFRGLAFSVLENG